MSLKPEHKNYILKHEQNIREGNWEKFFEDGAYPHGIGEPLYLANIPFMGYLKYVPEYTFYDCEKLTSITIPSSVTKIGWGAFRYCNNLTSISIPASVTNISSQAFSGCIGLTAVIIPAGVKILGNRAFYRCESLTSVMIPNSVTLIGEEAFGRIPTELTITYDGSRSTWEKICNKDAFKNTYFTVNCSDGQLVKQRK